MRSRSRISAYAVRVEYPEAALAVVEATFAESTPFIERAGENLQAVIQKLLQARTAVKRGGTVLDVIADGSLDGWHAVVMRGGSFVRVDCAGEAVPRE